MWTDILSTQEAEYTKFVINQLNNVLWAKPLLNRIVKSGGLTSENMPLLFEARFAYELHCAGIDAEYEYKAGVGKSTVEFKLNTAPVWLIELVSIRESNGTYY
ncbi:MAG: hypothetical protein KAI43_14075 [Candidatus Aureabacteria bacterium]|nr:hypothetical protein [Candidatus Auribacterota bacterium]